jgi:hypothetical protein
VRLWTHGLDLWTGRKHGDSPLCPPGDEGGSVFAKNGGAWGQSRLSPCFRGLVSRGLFINVPGDEGGSVFAKIGGGFRGWVTYGCL